MGSRGNRLAGRRSKAALISFLALAAVAPAALAGGSSDMPKPEDPTIVPGISLGGVSIGQPIAEAEAAWGNRGECKWREGTRWCNYESKGGGIASLAGIDGELQIATLMAPAKHNEWIFRGPLMDFDTERGDLGLGDKLKRIAKRYPEGKREGRFLFFDEGGVRMSFFASELKTGRVTQIILAAKQLP